MNQFTQELLGESLQKKLTSEKSELLGSHVDTFDYIAFKKRERERESQQKREMDFMESGIYPIERD